MLAKLFNVESSFLRSPNWRPFLVWEKIILSVVQDSGMFPTLLNPYNHLVYEYYDVEMDFDETCHPAAATGSGIGTGC